MGNITSILWDIGGVVLTNGWDEPARRGAAEHFGLDWTDFEPRHRRLEEPFDRAHMTLDAYLDETVFYRSRPFTREAFKDFMFSCSRPIPQGLEMLSCIAHTRRYWMAALNNEPLELNLYRIETFGLRRYLTAFFSSCFLGLVKPGRQIFQRALQIAQRRPEECLFIDDRLENCETALQLGITTFHCSSRDRLHEFALSILESNI